MMFAFGTRLVFDELPVRSRLPTAVSASPMVMLNGPVARPKSVIRLVIAAIVGAALPGV